MSGFYKKAVVWLGLNEEYPDAGGDFDGPEPGEGAHTESAASGAHEDAGSLPGPNAEVEPGMALAGAQVSDATAPQPTRYGHDSSTVRPIPMDDPPGGDANAGGSGTVRVVPMGKSAVPETVVPSSYNNAQDVADVYKDGKPVVVDLVSAERDLSRRLIDFSAGLCYGLGGRMEKLKNDVYLLIPDGVEVSTEDKERFS